MDVSGGGVLVDDGAWPPPQLTTTTGPPVTTTQVDSSLGQMASCRLGLVGLGMEWK